tara:strand:- start:762 stop:1256 length:495 start_codon:yes stop_codon:yes gene_type:complete
MKTLTTEELKVLKDIFLESDFKIHDKMRNYYINRKKELGESIFNNDDRAKEQLEHHNEKYQFYLSILEKINLMIEEVQEGRAITELNFGNGFNENNSIAIIWCTQDIHSAIDNMDLDWTPTGEQSLEILSWIKNKHDASVGVSWETLYIYIQTFYDEIQESDNE